MTDMKEFEEDIVVDKPPVIKGRVVVIDADSIAYRSAAASETRSIEVTHIPTAIKKVFSTRTEFKDLLKKKGKLDKLDEYEIKDVQEAEPIENCLHTIKVQVQRIISCLQAEEGIILVGAKSTYRESLPLPSLYKGNRTDSLRPVHLKEAKRYMIQVLKAKEIHDIESDDAVIIEAIRLKRLGKDVVVASIDKDCRQIEDINIWDYSKEPDEALLQIKGHSIDKIQKAKTIKVIGSGVGFLAYQILAGDSTDGYKPTELCKVKFGDVGAYNALKDCKTAKEFLEVVIAKYKEWYPEAITYTAWDAKEYTKDWKDILDMYFKCAYMLRNEFDTADSKEFFKEYGVNLDAY